MPPSLPGPVGRAAQGAVGGAPLRLLAGRAGRLPRKLEAHRHRRRFAPATGSLKTSTRAVFLNRGLFDWYYYNPHGRVWQVKFRLRNAYIYRWRNVKSAGIKFAKGIDNGPDSRYNRLCQGQAPFNRELILGCALADAFTHRFIKGFRVGLSMSSLRLQWKTANSRRSPPCLSGG